MDNGVVENMLDPRNTSARTMSQLLPQSALLRAAAIAIGIHLAVAAQDIAGLSYSATIPFSLRAPAMMLSTLGAFSVLWFTFAWCEARLANGNSVTLAVLRRAGIALVVLLCIAAPIAAHFSFPAPSHSTQVGNKEYFAKRQWSNPIERPHNGEAQLRASATLSAPLRSAHVER